MIPTLELPILPISLYRFIFKAEENIQLPEYSGSAWRGAFGHALKKSACVTQQRVCKECILYQSCIYSYVFETPPPVNSKKMRRYNAAPHPFVLDMPEKNSRDVTNGQELSIGVNLFGRGQEHLPYFIHSFAKVGQQGLGRNRGKLTLVRVEHSKAIPQPEWHEVFKAGKALLSHEHLRPVIPDAPEHCQINIKTPLRLKADGRNLKPQNMAFSYLFSNLLRRISMLTAFHTDTALETDFAGLTKTGRYLDISNVHLKWMDWTRYSSRQQNEIKMGGIIGTFDIELSEYSALWPYLWLGQWTHAGKGTSMGMGQYSIKISQACETCK